MKRAALRVFGGVVLALAMITAFGQIQSYSQNENGEIKNVEITAEEANVKENSSRSLSGPTALEGSWDVIATFRVCATGAAIRSFPSMNTFIQGGTSQEYGIGSGLFRGPGHGVWSHLGGRRYFNTFRFFRFNPDGTPLDRVRVRQYLELNFLADQYTSSSTTEFSDLNGNVFMTGCATEVATRFR